MELLAIKILLQSNPNYKVNWTEALTICWPVFRVDNLWYRYAKVQVSNCITHYINVALIAITPFDVTALSKDI